MIFYFAAFSPNFPCVLFFATRATTVFSKKTTLYFPLGLSNTLLVILSMRSEATCLQGLPNARINVATPLQKAKPQVSMRKHSCCE